MEKNTKPEDGNLIHLNGPGLLPSRIINDFKKNLFSKTALEEGWKRCLERFEKLINTYPAYLWELNGEPSSFFIYKEWNRKVEILWCHQLNKYFPKEIFIRPALENLLEAMEEDLHAERITSQFPSWSKIIGVDLLSMGLPWLGFRRFDVELMTVRISNKNSPDKPEIPEGIDVRRWADSRKLEAAELMCRVGDNYMDYINMTPEECLVSIDEIYSAALSKMAFNEADELVGFITSNEKGWIGQIFVREDYQRKGLGAYFISDLIHRLVEKKINRISLAVLSDNPSAKGLYQKFGFSSVGSNPMWAWLAST
ncbi:MAG: GNAT family N-acetyltransferase [candidate division Zixibacteria bacterium]|nr:GNAT family N-acetyltransferase [candidate division Zixibacteria bacterium]